MAKSIKLQTSENDGTVASKNISELDQDSKREKPVTRHQRESAITRAADERYEKIKQSEIHISERNIKRGEVCRLPESGILIRRT